VKRSIARSRTLLHCAWVLSVVVGGSASLRCAPWADEASEEGRASAALRTPHWSGRIHGGATEWVSGVATDSNSEVAVVGTFTGPMTPDLGGAGPVLNPVGESDVFVARYTSSGALRWAFRLGAAHSDEGNAIAVDAAGRTYITGYFYDTVDFDPSPSGVFNLTTAPGMQDAFIAEYDSSGAFVWADHLHSSLVSNGLAIAVDSGGNLAWGGGFRGTVSGPLVGPTGVSSVGFLDAFVALYDSGRHVKFFRSIGGAGGDNNVRSVAIAPDGGVVATGEFLATAAFGSGVSLTSFGNYDAFFTRVAPSGAVLYARALGGPNDDGGHGIAVDASGTAFLVAGGFQASARLEPPSTGLRFTNGNTDAFVGRYSLATGAVMWVDTFGGTGDDAARAISTRGSLVTVAGYVTGNVDLDPGAGTFFAGGSAPAMFASQFNLAGAFGFAVASSGSGGASARAVSLDATGSSVIGGAFGGTAFIEPSTLTAAGTDGFLVRRRP
jgi:hypothetical protein